MDSEIEPTTRMKYFMNANSVSYLLQCMIAILAERKKELDEVSFYMGKIVHHTTPEGAKLARQIGILERTVQEIERHP